MSMRRSHVSPASILLSLRETMTPPMVFCALPRPLCRYESIILPAADTCLLTELSNVVAYPCRHSRAEDRQMATGQPSSGKSEYGELAHCLLGATNETPPDFVGVTRPTIWRWVATHLDFADALRCGRAVVDAAVVRWLKKAGARAETTREEVR